jgi:hypothetical protein
MHHVTKFIIRDRFFRRRLKNLNGNGPGSGLLRLDTLCHKRVAEYDDTQA